MKIRNLLIAALLIIPVFLITPKIVVAEQSSDTKSEDNKDENISIEEATETINDLKDKIEELEGKIKDTKSKGDSLQKEIDSFNSQIELTELRIAQSLAQIIKKEEQIYRLENDIDDLGTRITKLVDSIDVQEEVLNDRIRARYKTKEDSPVVVLFGSDTLTKVIQKSEYLKVIERQDKRLLDQMNKTKKAYGLQKDLFEDKKQQEEELKQQLENEKANLERYNSELAQQKEQKNELLSITKNDEKTYQDLLAEAKKELEQYQNYANSTGQGIIGPNGLGGGKDGWYYSQRDSRWAYDSIGNSPYNIFTSGCLVSSVAMVHKYYGFDTKPSDIADKNSNFFYGMMRVPWPGPGGRSYTMLGWGYPGSAIDKELKNDNPVIVGVTANNSAGTHFIVLYEGKDGDYKMNDPIWGPDLDFQDYYSTNQIFEAVAFK